MDVDDEARDYPTRGIESYCTGTNVTTVPGELLSTYVLTLIFQQLFPDNASLARASRVCKQWYATAADDELWVGYGEALVTSTRRLADEVATAVASAKEAAVSPQAQREHHKNRLAYLNATATLLAEHLKLQIESRAWQTYPDTRFTCHLLHSTKVQLAATLDMLARLKKGTFSITANFDIYELTLRRYYEEIRVLLPAEPNARCPGQDPRLALLLDDNAREMWLTKIGGRCHTHFDLFYSRVLEVLSPSIKENPRFHAHIRHYVNFPCDNLMTVYRFHVLIALFGPGLAEIAFNFEHYALGKGFLGLVNVIAAEELIQTMKPTDNIVFIRFSRQKPTLLAFTSYNAAEGRIEHRRNTDDNGNPVAIAVFLKRRYPGYTFIDMGVDDIATKMETIHDYSSYRSPYYG